VLDSSDSPCNGSSVATKSAALASPALPETRNTKGVILKNETATGGGLDHERLDRKGLKADEEDGFSEESWLDLPAALYFVAVVAIGLCAATLLPLPDACFFTGFGILAVIIIRSDLESFLIPDWASLSVLLLGLARVIIVPLADSWGMRGENLPSNLWPALWSALATALLGFVLFYVIARFYHVFTGREGLGFGDVKLAGALGVWLDPFSFSVMLQLAAFSALLVALLERGVRQGLRTTLLPFGAFLTPCAWLCAFLLALEPDLLGLRP